MKLMLQTLLTGTMLGLSVAAPFGPIALLCVQRSIAAGAGLGIVTGLGAATVHLICATLAIAGADVISTELAIWGQPVRLASCTILLCLGVRVLRRPAPSSHAPQALQFPAAFTSSLVLALCNPLTIVPYLLFAASAAATEGTETALSPWFALGVFVGATTWYSVVSSAAALFRSGLPPCGARVLNYTAGAMLIGFGLLTVCR